jgi:hypothetical protein
MIFFSTQNNELDLSVSSSLEFMVLKLILTLFRKRA